ncbi:TetR/AcrR family transcriptional regulator [Adhaeribacter radiodurans]|uniref:TetR/AcrR family transcriptional regulator n=1 Tax=Adhaeribacter radiodurans TaxID=2745197 RepID=A0A7L7LC48_9BACT|nr:TetR/AcrR family transcriptional regulator [Adhaeribacter radiodurans]QMU30420.1 TetR/AcrR family transcriptional regulator [Adhaeribacter radiodurans]
MEQITEKKKIIFDTTLTLVRANGFHGTTMSMLIKSSGVAAGTIYHYFDSKDALILELHAYIREIMATAILEGDNENLNFKDRFIAYWTRQWQFYTQHPEALYFIEQFVNSPYYKQCPQPENDRCQNIITHFVKTGIETGILKSMNYKLMGIMVHSSIIKAAKVKLNNYLPVGDEELKQIIDMVWDGMVIR